MVDTAQIEASRGVPERWQFSPWRLRGHRDRLGWSRVTLAVAIGVKPDTVKMYEYGKILPSLPVFLLLADLLGISPNELCRTSQDNKREYLEAKAWIPLESPPVRNPPT